MAGRGSSARHPARKKNFTRRDVNRALKARGREERLVQGRGYCYFIDGEASAWYSSSVPVCWVTDFTVKRWLLEFDLLVAQKLNVRMVG